jgi:hypothetical protein
MPPPNELRGRPARTPSHEPDTTDHGRSSSVLHPSASSAVNRVDRCHAVLVFTPRGRWTRRLYLSLHAADAAMVRARDRQLEAYCVLVELVPVPGVPVVLVGGDAA